MKYLIFFRIHYPDDFTAPPFGLSVKNQGNPLNFINLYLIGSLNIRFRIKLKNEFFLSAGDRKLEMAIRRINTKQLTCH